MPATVREAFRVWPHFRALPEPARIRVRYHEPIDPVPCRALGEEEAVAALWNTRSFAVVWPACAYLGYLLLDLLALPQRRLTKWRRDGSAPRPRLHQPFLTARPMLS